MSESKLPTVAKRLIIAVLGVNTAAVAGIIATMLVTQYLSGALRIMLAGALIVLIFIIWASVLRTQILSLVSRPLGSSLEAAEAIAGGETTRRLPVGVTRELDQLARSVNRMTEQLLTANQLRMRVEKLATMGRIAAGVSHEIGNPLSAIANYAHVLRMRTADVEGSVELLDALDREITRIDRIMRGLLDYSRPRRLTPKPVVVDSVIEDAIRLLSDQGITRRFNVSAQLEAPQGQVYAERHDLEQVFVNLMLNAVDAMDREGKVVMRTRISSISSLVESQERRRTDNVDEHWTHSPSRRAVAWLARPGAPEKFLQIVIADSGTGVAPEDQEKIFEPFFSTKQPGKGTGLGLAIVASTIENLGGTIWVQRAREGGAAFVILLPLYTVSGFPAISGDVRARARSMSSAITPLDTAITPLEIPVPGMHAD